MKFDLRIPTDIRFGAGRIADLDALVPPGARVLLLFGGGSIKANGVFEEVTAALKGRHVVEFGGVEANPLYETLQKAARLAREHDVDLVLGVGGGSVIDAAKFLATIIAMEGDDPWDQMVAGERPERIVPVGAVLTLPATASESNPVSVISHRGRRLKFPFRTEGAKPAFAILDPETMVSLSRRQLENGVVDAFTHVLEQYMTWPVAAPIQYGYCETLMSALAQWGPKLVEEPSPEARETVMWAANQALNGLIGAGLPQDWSTHMIGHALTALYGIDHARTLSAVMPAVMRDGLEHKKQMLARYGRKVWEIEEADDSRAAELAIEKTEAFFARMGCPVRLGEFPDPVDAEDVVDHLVRAGQTRLGERRDITPERVLKILEMAA